MRSTSHEYYKTLGVPRTASPDQIRRAHRKLARRYHPDFNPGDKLAEERFKNIQEAYDVLIDSSARRLYDQTAFKSKPAPAPTPAAAPASARPHPAADAGPSEQRKPMPEESAEQAGLRDFSGLPSDSKFWEISEGLVVILFASFLVALTAARAGLAEQSFPSLSPVMSPFYGPIAILAAMGFLLGGTRGNFLDRCALINAAVWSCLILYRWNPGIIEWSAMKQISPYILATHLPVMLGAWARRSLIG
jgi:hypothetical protein